MNENLNTESEEINNEEHQITFKSFFGHPVIQGTIAMVAGAVVGNSIVDSPSAREIGATVGLGTVVAAYIIKDRWSLIMTNPTIQTISSGISRLG